MKLNCGGDGALFVKKMMIIKTLEIATTIRGEGLDLEG